MPSAPHPLRVSRHQSLTTTHPPDHTRDPRRLVPSLGMTGLGLIERGRVDDGRRGKGRCEAVTNRVKTEHISQISLRVHPQILLSIDKSPGIDGDERSFSRSLRKWRERVHYYSNAC